MGAIGMCSRSRYANVNLSQSRAAAPSIANVSSKQVRSYAADAKAAPTEVSSILEQRIRGVQEEAGLAETGRGSYPQGLYLDHRDLAAGTALWSFGICTNKT